MLLHLVETAWDGKILTTANELRAGVVDMHMVIG